MKKLKILFLFLFTNFLLAQVAFQPGYYVDKEGLKHEGLIKNYQWKNNPKEIEFRESENSAVKTIKGSDILEFFVDNQKFLGANVLLDRSSRNLNSLSTSRDFDMKEEYILLKLLVSGDIALYQSFDGSGLKFFAKSSRDDVPKFLKFKEYSIDNTSIGKNEEYKNQLKILFADNSNVTSRDIDNLYYRSDDIIYIFSKHLGIQQGNLNGKKFHIYAKPGIGISKYNIFSLSETFSSLQTSKINILFRLGIELEYVFNFNKGKWSLFSDPSFQTANIDIYDFNKRNFAVKYSSIQIPVGMKYSLFLSDASKIYLIAAVFQELPIGSKTFTVDNISFGSNSEVYKSFGIGYNYKNFGIEGRWGNTPHFFTSNFGQINYSDMRGFSFSLSYKLY